MVSYLFIARQRATAGGKMVDLSLLFSRTEVWLLAMIHPLSLSVLRWL